MKKITDIQGVYGGGIFAGIKESGLDLSYIYVPEARAAAGVFTQNLFRAACIDHNISCFAVGTPKAVIINSGNANAITGKRGKKDVIKTAQVASKLLCIPFEQVAIASTGSTGHFLPIDVLCKGLRKLLKEPMQKNGDLIPEAILTTDLGPKTAHVNGNMKDMSYDIFGITKGAGMIAPNMATTLSFLATNLAVEQTILERCLKKATDKTFNMISVDSDTSTNDMILIWSTGEKIPDLEPDQIEAEFSEYLEICMRDLADQLIQEGEGASKIIEVKINGAIAEVQARRIAKSIIDSPLVKTAITGESPNWGRVLVAAGKTRDVSIDPLLVDLSFGDVRILESGEYTGVSNGEIIPTMQKDKVQITIDLNLGNASALAWGCNLTCEYIHINADYS